MRDHLQLWRGVGYQANPAGTMWLQWAQGLLRGPEWATARVRRATVLVAEAEGGPVRGEHHASRKHFEGQGRSCRDGTAK